MAGSMKTRNHTKEVPEGFTLSMACMDALPVLFFCVSAGIVSLRFPSMLFRIGAVLVILAGALKVSWKFVIALAHKNIRFLNRQMRYLMPTGFLLILLSLVIDRAGINWGTVLHGMLGIPSLLFFLLGIAGMCAMGWFAGHLDGNDAHSNWIEQGTNALAQMSIMLGILFM